MTLRGIRVLVTGAEERQGLAVIRGLGRAGAEVIAGAARADGLGLRSRWAMDGHTYTSPLADPVAFARDLLRITRRTRPTFVVPVAESTLVAMECVRPSIEAITRIAAPPSAMLRYALDKGATVELAQRLGVPVPRTLVSARPSEWARHAAGLRFPVAIKPRGPRQYDATAHRADFKVRYAADPHALDQLARELGDDIGPLLVQECTGGIGRCMTAVCRHGRPLALFPYERVRELPFTGGVSVMRRSLQPCRELERLTTRLLAALEWHGVAMVEFKFDPARGAYTLMEINGRFNASTALALDAGLNIPALTVAVYAGRPCIVTRPRSGVEERWLRGDCLALLAHLREGQAAATRAPGAPPLPSRAAAVWRFLRDFRPRVHLDEFAAGDWRPALRELGTLARTLLNEGRWAAGALLRRIGVRRRRPAALPAVRAAGGR